MSPPSDRLLASIERNFDEANNALLKVTAHNALCRVEISCASMSFFVIAMDALLNDAVSHLVRILDQHKDAASFWYVARAAHHEVKQAAAEVGLDLDALGSLAVRLKSVRDRAHFHIDLKTVTHPTKVWEDASISGSEMIEVLNGVAATLARIWQLLAAGSALTVEPYDGSDVERIVNAFEQTYGPVHGA